MRLLEREGELAASRNALQAVERGTGRALVVEGVPGIGKSALFGAICAQASARGFHLLAARGGELERELAFGVVRDLFGRDGGPAGPAPADPAAVLHGLYWRVVDLAERSPVLVAVDDAQWADEDSAGFLTYLARRIADLPVAVLVSVRPGESPLAERLREGLETELLQPGPLSAAAAAALVRVTLPDADDGFCAACATAAGGNPFLLEQLAAEVAAAQIEPRGATATRVAELVPAGVARLAVDRVRRRDERAVTVAQAVAVLGPDASPANVAALVELDPDALRELVAELVRAHVLEDAVPLAFVHPLMRSAFYGRLGALDRADAHTRAWRLLAQQPSTLARVAAHLQLAPPAADPRAVELLVRAAGTAIAEGAPAAAAAALRRALEEPAPEADRPRLLWRLGQAEAALGLPEAPARLVEASGELDGPDVAVAAQEASRALFYLGRFAEATDVADEAAARASGDLRQRLRAQALASASWIGSRVHERIAEVDVPETPTTPGESLLLDQVAEAGWFSCMAAEEHVAVARRALSGPGLLEQGAGLHSLWVLIMTDRHDEAREVSERMLELARRSGSEQVFASTNAFISQGAERRGDLLEAEALAAAGLEVARRHDRHSVGFVFSLTGLIWALTARGRLEEASALEAENGDLLDMLPTSFLSESLRFAFARLWAARGEFARGADALVEITRTVAGLGIDNPAPWSTRNFAVPALLQLGRRDEARALAGEEIELARAYGAAGALGGALRSVGMAEGGDEGIETLRESVRTLEPSGMRLYLVRSLIELGAALRRAGRKAEAREPLGRAMDLAHEIGADGLAQAARDELAAAGARPRRLALKGAGALTASERRVAELAAQGLTNREIAQALFVTPKTVEKHLSNGYDKLGISSRGEIAAQLA